MTTKVGIDPWSRIQELETALRRAQERVSIANRRVALLEAERRQMWRTTFTPRTRAEQDGR